ncbi:molybdenum cofactor guanylyltransferase [Rhizomonospora bruguierae]|uniref:molybdenum cofactor guanylyltransferase n=1 Tax=Rhizomonospora bruguierae TaxID=1581705 RepID=UPI001BCAFF78|nr:NTP transferase domain-containing protein [Micromonospora sp. NBRC 107566]
MEGYGALILAGGAGRRLGGREKPARPVGGRPMLLRVLDALADADPRVVVGAPALTGAPTDVLTTVEEPPGGGPAAAVVAGLRLVPAHVPVVALVAADLPLLTGDAVRRLITTVESIPSTNGAIYMDVNDRPQWLCGVWRPGALRRRVHELGGTLHGTPLRVLLTPLAPVPVTVDTDGLPPFFDCDTDADLRQAEEWIR